MANVRFSQIVGAGAISKSTDTLIGVQSSATDVQYVISDVLKLAANTLGASNLGNTVGTSGVVSGNVELVLAGGNNVTLSQSINGSSATITISGANAPAQTNQSGGVYASSNTFGTSSGTFDARSLSIAGSGAVQVAASNSGWVISSPIQSNQQLSMYAVSNTTLSTSSTGNASALSFQGAGGVSVGISGGSVVISGGAGGGGLNSASVYAVSNTTLGTSGNLTLSALSFEGAGAVSVGVSNGSVIISANAAAADGVNIISASGNTVGVLTTFSSASIVLAGGNNITLSQTSNSITISGANQSNQQLSLFAVSNTTLSTSRTGNASALSFAGAGIVSVGASAGSVVISASVAAQSNQQLSMYAVSNTTLSTSSTGNASALSFQGAGGVSVGISGGSVVISSPANSTITQGNMVTISTNGSTVTIDAFANILSASGNTSGTLATFSSGTMVLAGGNNITLSQSSNTITIVGGAGGGGGTLSMFAVSNTTQSTSGSVAATALSFNGAGAVSVGISGASVVISAPTQTNQQLSLFAVGNTTLSTSRTGNASALSFDGAGIVSVGASAGSVVISATVAAQTNQTGGIYASSNTTGATSGTYDARTLSIAGAGGVSVEASNSGWIISSPTLSQLFAGNNISLSSNGASITIEDLYSQGAISQYEPWQFGANTSASSLGVSSLYFQHFEVPEMQACRMDRLISLSINAAVSGSTLATGTRSNVWTYNETVGLYTRGTGANSTNLFSYMSNSWSFGITESVSIFTTQNALTAGLAQSYTLGFPGNIDTNGGVTSSTFSSASSTQSAGVTVSQANQISNVSGLLRVDVPFGSTLLSGGDYWLAIVGRTATTTGGTSTNLGSVSNIVLTNFNAGLQRLGQTATATSNTLIAGNGVWTAQTSQFPSSVAINAISNNSNVSLYGNFMNVSM